jgi:hypothetical protein
MKRSLILALCLTLVSCAVVTPAYAKPRITGGNHPPLINKPRVTGGPLKPSIAEPLRPRCRFQIGRFVCVPY